MKREIKFRGKDPKGGWVEGYYLQDLTQGEMRSYIFNCPCYWEVVPETVGQFTGLLDKMRKEIYPLVVPELYRQHRFKPHTDGMVAHVPISTRRNSLPRLITYTGNCVTS